MYLPMKPALRHAVALAACLATTGAWSCSAVSARGQITVSAAFGKTPMQPPHEVELKAGDLLSVLVPHGASVQMVDGSDKATQAATALDAERYRSLSAQGRGSIPVEVRAGSFPERLEWRHFGAATPGLIYLKLTAGKEYALVRVQIVEKPVAPLGTNLVWSEAKQGEPIALTQFDTLTLDLPGEPGDGWQVGMRSGKAALKSLSAGEGGAARVQLRIEAKPGAPDDELSIQRQGRELYRFTVRPRPVPAC